MAGLAISRVVIGLEGAQHGVFWCIINSITVMHHAPTTTSGACLCVGHISSPPTSPDPLTNTLTISPHILALEAQTNRQTTQHNMHEIAHTDYFRAWTYAIVVYYRACERGNRIRAVVGCGGDLRRRRNAPSQSASTRGGRETARGWDEKNDSVLFYFSSSHCSLSNPWLRWILLWCDVNLGRQRDIDRQRERRRYGADAAP